MKTKVCSKCGVEKPFGPNGEFYVNSSHSSGYSPRCKACDNLRRAALKKKCPERVQNERLKRYYGANLEQYNELLTVQGGKCAVCGKTPPGRMHMDHDHSTGKIRGLLCGTCNAKIGRCTEKWILAASEYLQRLHLDPVSQPTRPRSTTYQLTVQSVLRDDPVQQAS
jgi:hypothetical protein